VKVPKEAFSYLVMEDYYINPTPQHLMRKQGEFERASRPFQSFWSSVGFSSFVQGFVLVICNWQRASRRTCRREGGRGRKEESYRIGTDEVQSRLKGTAGRAKRSELDVVPSLCFLPRLLPSPLLLVNIRVIHHPSKESPTNENNCTSEERKGE